MDPETLLLLGLVVILIEYILRLKGKINKQAEEKFEQWKNNYLAEVEKAKAQSDG